jgi:hypothetical protein
MLKQTLLSIVFITAAAALPLINRQGVGVVATSPDASQEVANAITAFADDVNAVSSALISLQTEINSDVITAIATSGFSAESNEDAQRQVLLRFAGDAGSNANQLITQFTPDVLSGFQAIINEPYPGIAKDQVQSISSIRSVLKKKDSFIAANDF